MEQLDVSVSSTRTDYGSTTLKTLSTSHPNPRSDSNGSSYTEDRQTHHPDPDGDFDLMTDNDFTAASVRSRILQTRFCKSFSTNISLGYQRLPNTDSSNATTHLFAHRVSTSQERFAQRQTRRTAGYSKMDTTNINFGKMSLDIDASSATANRGRHSLERVEYFLSVLNQILIGFVTIYMSWLCWRAGLAGTALHAWLVTIGFSFLMAEAIMCHYGANVLTFTYKRTTKTTLHWVLQVLGGGCGVAGVLIKCIQKDFLLISVHGKLGFSAFILCLTSMLCGLAALFPLRLKRFIQPLLNKAFHNFVGIGTFVVALLAQYYGYQTGFFSRRVEKDFCTMTQCITLLSLVLTSIGPLKSLWLKFQNIKKLYF